LPQVYKLPILIGRIFTQEEMQHRRRLAVIGFGPLRDLFPVEDPVGKRIRIRGMEYTVIGAFDERKSLFGGMADNFVLVPFTTYRKDFASRFNEFTVIDMVPASGYTLGDMEDDVTALMRARHRLKPGEANDFDLLAQDQVLEFLGSILGPIGISLFAIASVGLMVGGIGVSAIMLVSVTERTREVGIRKALGARRIDILWQFLIEAATLTGIGGILGVAVGMGLAQLTKVFFKVPAAAPVAYIVVAVIVTAGFGIVCGLFPALRAANLDPVEAMRQE
jgi:putative ABC transport system permease protein